MKKWQPFIVVENNRPGPGETHKVVLRVKDCEDLDIFEASEVDCFKTAYEMNSRVRVSLKDFTDGVE